jgi:hypothetical protein
MATMPEIEEAFDRGRTTPRPHRIEEGRPHVGAPLTDGLPGPGPKQAPNPNRTVQFPGGRGTFRPERPYTKPTFRDGVRSRNAGKKR